MRHCFGEGITKTEVHVKACFVDPCPSQVAKEIARHEHIPNKQNKLMEVLRLLLVCRTTKPRRFLEDIPPAKVKHVVHPKYPGKRPQTVCV